MGGVYRRQSVVMAILCGRIPHLPIGDYQIHLDKVEIVNGSVKITGHVIQELDQKNLFSFYTKNERKKKGGKHEKDGDKEAVDGA